jgi:hypothetical protein
MKCRFAILAGLAAFMALVAPATAATISYDLTGDTTAAYGDPGSPGIAFIDLADTSTVSGQVPSQVISVGDTLHITISLNHPISPTEAFLFLQKAPSLAFGFDASMSFFNGATEVFAPGSWLTPSIGSAEALAFGIGNHTFESDTLTFDKIIANVVINVMTQPTLILPQTWSHLEVYDPNLVATTPLPGALLMMMTALGGLGVVGWRKRTASA